MKFFSRGGVADADIAASVYGESGTLVGPTITTLDDVE
jgi:hypothetical protein